MRSSVRVLQSIVPHADCHELMRVLWRDFCERGVSPDELQAWRESACPFPHLRNHSFVVKLGYLVRRAVDATGQACEPQFIWHLPQSDLYTAPPPHVDKEPPWANGRQYEVVAGVALTPWSESNGTLRCWLNGDAEPRSVHLQTGDVVVMLPDLPHASGVNHGINIRAGLYFRWLC